MPKFVSQCVAQLAGFDAIVRAVYILSIIPVVKTYPMFSRSFQIIAFLSLALLAHKPAACGLHGIYLDPDEFGVVGGTFIRMAGLAPGEPVFKVKHRSMAKVALGAESEVRIEYERPWLSRDVRMELVGTAGVSLETDSIALDRLDGEVKVRFSLDKPGFNNIKIKVSGLHKGKPVERSSVIYIQAKKALAKAGN